MAFQFSRIKIVVSVILVLLAADAIVAYGFSSRCARFFEEAVNKHANAKIAVKAAHFHPIFLSFSAKDLEVFDLEQNSRVLYARRVSGRLGFTSLLAKRVYLSELVFEKAELEVSKDEHGIINVEKIAQPRQEAEDPFYGAKHKDWFFNLYQRIVFAVEKRAEKQKRQRRSKAVFKVKRLRIKDSKVVLKGRIIDLPPFEKVDILVRNLRWLESSEAYFDSITAQGIFETDREGRFDIRIGWKNREAEVFAKLLNFDMATLRPIYSNSLPVYFEKGYLTLRSHSRVSAKKLYSKNRLRMNSYQMIPTLMWSPENQAFISALNRHPDFDIQFTITGTPDQPAFEGFEESLMEIVKDDFNESALSLIRQRTGIELKKIVDRLTP